MMRRVRQARDAARSYFGGRYQDEIVKYREVLDRVVLSLRPGYAVRVLPIVPREEATTLGNPPVTPMMLTAVVIEYVNDENLSTDVFGSQP